jgi:hypothetical protein
VRNECRDHFSFFNREMIKTLTLHNNNTTPRYNGVRPRKQIPHHFFFFFFFFFSVQNMVRKGNRSNKKQNRQPHKNGSLIDYRASMCIPSLPRAKDA